MVTRRGYLSSTGGFADGFTSGFGLMNEAFNDRRQREDVAARRAEDARQFDATQKRLGQEAQNTASYRQSMLDANVARDQATADFREAEAERDAARDQATSEFRTAQEESQALVREAQLTAAETTAAVKQAELDAIQSAQKDKEAQEAIFQLDAIVRRARETGVAPDMETLLSLIDSTEGAGTYDIKSVMGEDFRENLATFTSTISEMIQGDNFDPEDPRIIAGFDAIVNARQGRLIGATVDKSFKNAPPEYQDGTWEVVSREARDISISEGSDEFGPPALEAGANVLVTIRKKDDKGETAQYIAPLTDSRDPKSSEQVKIQVNEFIDGVAGTSVLVDYFDSSGISDVIKSAEIERMGGYAEFEQRKQEVFSQLIAERDGPDGSGGMPNSRSLGFAKPNSEVGNQELERLAESRVLGRGKKQPSYRDQANTTLLITSEAIKTEMGLAKYVVRENGKNVSLKPEDLDDQTLFRIAATLKERGGRFIVTPDTRRILEEFTESRGGKVVGGNANTKSVSDRVSGVRAI